MSLGTIGLPMAMLGFLLFNAGMGVDLSAASAAGKQSAPAGVRTPSESVDPIAYIGLVTLTMRLWHNPDEVQNILVGLALVASMPIAGSSTAWSQKRERQVAVSLGLVLGSTVSQPVHDADRSARRGLDDDGQLFRRLARIGRRSGLLLSARLGLFVRCWAFATRAIACRERYESRQRRTEVGEAPVVLLLLTTPDASLPYLQAIRKADLDFLAVRSQSRCCCACRSSSPAAVILATSIDRQVRGEWLSCSGLGMNNKRHWPRLGHDGAADHPQMLLPITSSTYLVSISSPERRPLVFVHGRRRAGTSRPTTDAFAPGVARSSPPIPSLTTVEPRNRKGVG